MGWKSALFVLVPELSPVVSGHRENAAAATDQFDVGIGELFANGGGQTDRLRLVASNHAVLNGQLHDAKKITRDLDPGSTVGVPTVLANSVP